MIEQSILPSTLNFTSHRTTRRINLQSNETFALFDIKSIGCIKHWWLTYGGRTDEQKSVGRNLIVRIVLDEAQQPNVEMPLDVFFGVLFGLSPYRIENHYFKVLPRNGFNCYMPIFFDSSCRIELTNNGKETVPVWFMANWHEYEPGTSLASYRFHAVFRKEEPAESYGSFLMAEIGGKGLVTGMVKGICPKDQTDSWYHTGGDLWLIDGETNPHVIHGIGGEDVFGFSFGLYQELSEWTGTPYLSKQPPGPDPTKTKEVVAYRFFGFDSIAFDSSIIARFGSKANDMETVIYYYKDLETPEPPSAKELNWEIVGPFECNSFDDFDRPEFPEESRDEWQEKIVANFGQYAEPHGPREFEVGKRISSERTWVDFTRYFRAPQKGNVGTQPVNVSAYAFCKIDCPEACSKKIKFGFDDWMKIWVNGELVKTERHDDGFEVSTIGSVNFSKGKNTVLIKLSNFDNVEWRVWAFSFKITD